MGPDDGRAGARITRRGLDKCKQCYDCKEREMRRDWLRLRAFASEATTDWCILVPRLLMPRDTATGLTKLPPDFVNDHDKSLSARAEFREKNAGGLRHIKIR